MAHAQESQGDYTWEETMDHIKYAAYLSTENEGDYDTYEITQINLDREINTLNFSFEQIIEPEDSTESVFYSVIVEQNYTINLKELISAEYNGDVTKLTTTENKIECNQGYYSVMGSELDKDNFITDRVRLDYEASLLVVRSLNSAFMHLAYLATKERNGN